MANFVLIKDASGVWVGAADAEVTVSARSEDSNATTMHDAAYPDDKEIPVVDNEAKFSIADDKANHFLNVGITPPADPDDLDIVEVAADGSTQTLESFLAGEEVGAVEIKPK